MPCLHEPCKAGGQGSIRSILHWLCCRLSRCLVLLVYRPMSEPLLTLAHNNTAKIYRLRKWLEANPESPHWTHGQLAYKFQADAFHRMVLDAEECRCHTCGHPIDREEE